MADVGKRKMNPALKGLLIVLCIVLGVVVSGAIALAIAINIGNMNLHKALDDDEGAIQKVVAKATDDGQVVEYKGHTYEYNKNVASVVVIGHDNEGIEGYEGKSLADTIVLFTVDTKTNKVLATVVPRDTWCAVDLYDKNGNYASTKDMQITLSHGVNLPTIGECASNTVHSVSRIMYNMPIDYFVDFGADVIKNATAAVGGVRLQALETIPGTSIVEGQECLLDSNSAYSYISYRNKDKDDSSLDRQARQMQFIRAFAAKLSGMGVPGILSVYNEVSGDIATNLGLSEVSYLVSCFAKGDNAEIEIASLEGTTEVAREEDGVEYLRYHLNKDSIIQNTLKAYYTQVD